MSQPLTLELIDTHAGGDVSRIVTGGVAALPGASVRAQMCYLRDHADGLRRLLLAEPYGRPDMSVDLLVPAAEPGAAAGYIIMEVMGYPIYSGSNTICTATALLASGRVAAGDGEQRFTLEAPAGAVQVSARVRDGAVEAVTCEGLPSYVEAERLRLAVPGWGTLDCSIVYSGGFYALVDAAALGFELAAGEQPRLAACGHAIVAALQDRRDAHYSLGAVGALTFVHFMGPVERGSDGGARSRSATYVDPGVIARSTTGTGTSARLALMHARGQAVPGDTLTTVSLGGSSFVGTITACERAGDRDVVHNTITGRGFVIARSQLLIDPDDPLADAGRVAALLATGPAGARL